MVDSAEQWMMRALAAVEELSARYQRHKDDPDPGMQMMCRGWLQAIALFFDLPLQNVKEQLDALPRQAPQTRV